MTKIAIKAQKIFTADFIESNNYLIVEDNKFAEIFTLLIAGTQEINWFRNSSTTDYTVITEKQLDDVLAGKQVEGTKFSSFFDKNKRY